MPQQTVRVAKNFTDALSQEIVYCSCGRSVSLYPVDMYKYCNRGVLELRLIWINVDRPFKRETTV